MSDMTIQLGQTVYGGSLNVTTGVLTITWVGIADASSLNTWTKAVSNYGSFKCTVSDAIKVADAQKLVISSCYNSVSKDGASAGADNYIYTPNSVTIMIKDTAKNSLTAEEFAQILAGQQICYELATPQTIQLTPTQLTMLKGYNRLSSDGGGDITLTYKADRLAAIEAALAALT